MRAKRACLNNANDVRAPLLGGLQVQGQQRWKTRRNRRVYDARAPLLGCLQVLVVRRELAALVLQLGAQLGQVALDLVDVPLRIWCSLAAVSSIVNMHQRGRHYPGPAHCNKSKVLHGR